ncbi:MAG: hypothetical protein JNK48_18315 [Bryobacterales bacterium]|nr:hypothetical protein [Bryobacterales bacterium]
MPPDFTAQQMFSLWLVRISCALYFAALTLWILKPRAFPKRTWTAACVFYLAHMITAFAFFHRFSHSEAYQATARQTQALMGVYYGGGLYWNYAFTAIWIADAAWAWRAGYVTRPRSIHIAIHGFLAFLFFNATVVFGKGWIRIAGMVGFLALAAMRVALRSRSVGR